MSNEKRAPLLSDDGYRSIIDNLAEDCGVDETGAGLWAYTCMSETARAIRDHYERLITSGELRVVKTARVICSADTGWNPQCSECQKTIEGSDIDIGEFCRCGAKIIE